MTYPSIRQAALSLCLLASAVTLNATAQTEPDLLKGQADAALCGACHQADGSGMNIPNADSWPRLAGMNADYMVQQLLDFKSGKRQNVSMQPFAQMLNEQQIINVSAWFASLPAPVLTANTDSFTAEQLARGKQLASTGDWNNYIVPCSTCHGPDNLGAGSVFPAIAGQHFGYIRDQLQNWQQDKRDNDPQQLMAAIAKRMTSDDIQAVAAWLSTQPGAVAPQQTP
ncbi:MAG: c-type cytochrome [Pseudomonas sp.]